MALLTAAALRSLRAICEHGLSHTCTLTPVSSGPPDDWGGETATPGTPVTGVPCAFVTVQRSSRDESGVSVLFVPTISVAADTAIAVGDLVSDVVDQLGVVLAAGPFEVDRLADDTAGFGAPLLPVWELRATDVVQAP